MALVLAAGCESRVSKEDLGQVVFEMPEVPGWDKPVVLSELDPSEPAKAPPKKPAQN
jgi:hypothetical protein